MITDTTYKMQSDSEPITTLKTWERWAIAIFGVLAIVCSLSLFVLPQVHRSTISERDIKGEWKATERSDEVPRVTEPLVLLALGALALLFALNGLRVYRLSIGNNSVAFDKEKLKNQADPILNNPKTRDELDKELGHNPAAPYVEPDAGTTVIRDGKAYKVFSLYDISLKVLAAALEGWPDNDPPNKGADLTCALRRQGRGNHAYLLQFKDKRDVWVSFGGKGKEKPTVAFDLPSS